MLRFVNRPSPNHDARPEGATVDMLVLHYTGMPTAAEALERMCDPAAGVSAHYCIDEDGSVYRLVPEDRRAWHSGASSWAGTASVNRCSIGIELVNPGHAHGYRPFTEAQMRSLIALGRDLCERYPIAPGRVLAHSDVAPLRKQDPGELFNWRRLASAGIGLWPWRAAEAPALPPVAEVQAQLRRYGYDAPTSGTLDEHTRAVIAAFQRHFRPEAVTGRIDRVTAGRLAALLAVLDGAAERA